MTNESSHQHPEPSRQKPAPGKGGHPAMDSQACLLLDLFCQSRQTQGATPETINWYRKRLTRFFETTGAMPEQITSEVIRQYLAVLLVSESTKAGHFRAMRAFIYWGHDNDYFPQGNPFKGAKFKFADDPIKIPPPAAWITGVIDKIPKRPLVNHRDRALFRMAYHTGARIGELVALRRDALNLAEGWAQIYGKKTRKHRIVPLVAPLVLELAGWLGHCPGDFVFPRFDPAGNWAGGCHNAGARIRSYRLSNAQPMTPAAANTRWNIQQRAQGIPEAQRINLHMLRHGFGTHCREAGIEFADLMEAMGHSNPQVTLRYAKTCTATLARKFNTVWNAKVDQ